MSKDSIITKKDRDRFERQLREDRRRLTEEINRVTEGIIDDVTAGKNASNAPVHLGDAAPSQLHADVAVAENERNRLIMVDDALERIEDGRFGRCTNCGRDINPDRLDEIPFTPLCIVCARKRETDQQETTLYSSGRMRLTGFAAIEYAEREGILLNKSSDHIDDAATGLTTAEAEAIASDNAEQIWIDIDRERYESRQNLYLGRDAKEVMSKSRRAGQMNDELLPGQASRGSVGGSNAAGTPGGGFASGGIAGTNNTDGSTEVDANLEDAMSSGAFDQQHDDDLSEDQF